MATYVIGDVHGHLDALTRLVDEIQPGPEDVVVQLGDCINRGPDSFAVVEYWLHFDRCPFYVLGGNHEELLFDYLSEGESALLDYGGSSTIDSYRRHGWSCQQGDPSSIPPGHFPFYLQALPFTRSFLVTSHFIFTHAGWNLDRPPEKQNPHTIRWGRVTGWKQGSPTVIRGHTPHRRVTFRKGVIEVDTGCGLGGPLSCVALPGGAIISVPTS